MPIRRWNRLSKSTAFRPKTNNKRHGRVGKPARSRMDSPRPTVGGFVFGPRGASASGRPIDAGPCVDSRNGLPSHGINSTLLRTHIDGVCRRFRAGQLRARQGIPTRRRGRYAIGAATHARPLQTTGSRNDLRKRPDALISVRSGAIL